MAITMKGHAPLTLAAVLAAALAGPALAGHQGAGMHTLDQNLSELMQKGMINKEEARFRAVFKENF